MVNVKIMQNAEKRGKSLQKKIEEIARFYGWEEQRAQLVEEMAELIVALNKDRRTNGAGEAYLKKHAAAVSNVKEEIADVEIMLAQIKYLMSIDQQELDEIKAFKLDRTLDQIYSMDD